jgi:uncharacterized protein
MNKNDQISATEEFVKQNMKGYDSGHDWWHIERVRKLALFINEKEDLVDPFIVEIAALLHDTVDSKFAEGNSGPGYSLISDFMDEIEMSEIRDHVLNVIKNISFSNRKKSGNHSDPLLWVVQDADRLDAIGAIGIARAFNYGGFRNNPIYIPSEESGNTGKSTIGHFYDKLLKLKEMMNTATGRTIAEERHKILENFLEQFYKEWDFGTGVRNSG